MSRTPPSHCTNCGHIIDWGGRPPDTEIALYIHALETALSAAGIPADIKPEHLETVRPWVGRSLEQVVTEALDVWVADDKSVTEQDRHDKDVKVAGLLGRTVKRVRDARQMSDTTVNDGDAG